MSEQDTQQVGLRKINKITWKKYIKMIIEMVMGEKGRLQSSNICIIGIPEEENKIYLKVEQEKTCITEELKDQITLDEKVHVLR